MNILVADDNRLVLDGTPDLLADAKELIDRIDVAPIPEPEVRWVGGSYWCGRRSDW